MRRPEPAAQGPGAGPGDVETSPLLTDLYQLTMLQAYLDHGMVARATFEFFVRELPPQRRFLMAAGLDPLLHFLQGLRFAEDELRWLAEQGRFGDRLLDYLGGFRFEGDVDAVPEGSIVFANEPMVRVTASLPAAQLVESRLINLLHHQTLVASKAARCVLAAPGRTLVDFGLRRAHGAEAALLGARASFVAGFAGSATVLAARRFGIPMFGTMAHAYVQAHDEERDAFERFARSNRGAVVLLLDTYDTLAAARTAVALAPRLRESGIEISGVRLDSGDLAAHARAVRRVLDEGGLGAASIFASGNLDEFALRDLAASGAPIDGFGVGTRLDVSSDAPYLDCAYKLQEYAGRPRRKRSEGKATWPGPKQVYRRFRAGCMAGDVIALEHECAPHGEGMLRPVMRAGRRVAPPEGLDAIRDRARRSLEQLPGELRGLEGPAEYPVEISAALRGLAAQLDGARQRDAAPPLIP
jgi:nicotinate phosphoribosyltransferase